VKAGGGKSHGADFAPYLTLGLQLAISVLAFFFVGRWLDGVLGVSPWLMITGLVVGIVGGFIQFFRAAIRLGKREDNRSSDRRSAGGRHDER
jgi:ATP synthase protein I